jgi:hypothetical protein
MHLSERQRFKQLHFTAVMHHKLYRIILRMHNNSSLQLFNGWDVLVVKRNIDYVVFAWKLHVNGNQTQRHQVVKC